MARLRYAIFIACIAACGGDATAPQSYNNIAGSFAGTMQGVSQGIVLGADFTLTIQQSGAGQLTGSYALVGVLTDGLDAVAITGTGTISGTIAAGNNPSVNVTLRPGSPDCPNRTAALSGSFDTANQRLTVAGPIYVLNTDNCAILLTYLTTFILTK